MVVAQATEEEKWWRDNPSPEFTPEAGTLTLWNYPVAGTELAAGHKAAIDRFLVIDLLALGSKRESETVLKIRGHASPTGEKLANLDLSLLRAQAVRTYLSSLGFKGMLLSNVGAREPVDPDDVSGLGLARDRRVEILKVHLTKASDSGPLLEDEGQTTPSPQLVAAVQGDMQFYKFGPKSLMKSPLMIDFSAAGYIKVVSKNPDHGGSVTAGVAIKAGQVSGKVEAEVFEGLAGKFSIEPPKDDGRMPAIKVGAQLKGVFGKPEVGLQRPPKFVYVKFTSKDVVILGEEGESRLAFKGDVTFDIGPGPAMVQRLASLEASLGGTTAAAGFTSAELQAAGIGASGGTAGALAAVGGAIAVAALINGGIIYAVIDAKEESEAFTALLARRDGKATRVAWAILGADYEKNYLDRETQWTRALSSAAMLDAFRQGRRDVEAFLKVEDVQVAKIAAWKAKYAADGTTDGALIRQRVYEDVGGQEKSPDAGASL